VLWRSGRARGGPRRTWLATGSAAALAAWIGLSSCGGSKTGSSTPSTTPAPSGGSGSTYHVRTDGGTAEQCTGTTDAPYPGTGGGQACAWAHPFWALDEGQRWRLKGGDTLLIHSGSYRMGYGAPNTHTDWCAPESPWSCHLPPLPSGTSATSPTRLVGEGWDQGCSAPPELWGTERAEWILDLTGTSNAIIDCLVITDHSSCALDHCNSSVRCAREGSSVGDYADIGIVASDSGNVVLRHLNVHGLAGGGIHAGRLTDWSVEDVRLAGNGSVGWDGDVGDSSSNSGTTTFRRMTVEWNGCPETYPGGQPNHCWGQETCGGYGDGVGVARSGGHWIVEDSTFRYNVSDGLDLLYVGVDHPDSLVEVRRSRAYGNAGNQLKIGGSSRVVNSLAVSNCAYFDHKPFGQEMGSLHGGDHCRAGGAALSINLPRGGDSYVVNSTVASEGWATVEIQCNTANFPDQPACNGSERAYLQNGVFLGYQVAYLDYRRSADFVGDGDPGGFTTAETVDYDVVFGTEVSSPLGGHSIERDPRVVNADIDDFDGRLQAGSPAIDTGLPVGSLGGWVPADDLIGNARPYGSGVDRGAYEWTGTSVGAGAASLFLRPWYSLRTRTHPALRPAAAYGAGAFLPGVM
jgi:hypothetical protein